MAVIATACTEGIDAPVRTREIKVSVTGNLADVSVFITEGNGSAQSPASKAVFSDGEGMSWESTDAEKLGIVAETGNTWTSVHSTGISIAADKGATFTASVPENATNAYFVYPYNAGADNGTVHRFSFPAELTQARAGSSENFKFTSAKATDISKEAASIEPTLKMAGAVVRTVIYSASGKRAAESVTAVKLETKSSEANISATEYDYDFAEGAATVGGTCGPSVRVALSEAWPLEGRTGKENAAAVYLPIVPATTEGFVITVYTNAGAAYVFDSSVAKTWEDGQLYTFYLNLDKAVREMRKIVFHFEGAAGSDVYNEGNPVSIAVTGGSFDQWCSLYHSINGNISDSENRFKDDSGAYSCLVGYTDDGLNWIGPNGFGNYVFGNHIQSTISANETGNERTGILKCRLNREKFDALFPEYKDYISDDPIFTIKFTQAAE